MLNFVRNIANKALFLVKVCAKSKKEFCIFLLPTLLMPLTQQSLFQYLFIVIIVLFLMSYNIYSQKIFLLRQYVYLYVESKKLSTCFSLCSPSNRIYDFYIPKKVYENYEICKSCLPKLNFECKYGYPMFPCCNDRVDILTGKFDNEIIKLFNEKKIKLDL